MNELEDLILNVSEKVNNLYALLILLGLLLLIEVSNKLCLKKIIFLGTIGKRSRSSS